MRSARASIIGILDLLLELPPGLKAKWVAPRAMSAGIVTHLIHNFRLLRRPIADSSEASLVSRRVDELWRIVKSPQQRRNRIPDREATGWIGLHEEDRAVWIKGQ